MAALAKALAICAGTVGGAAACVATGVVPAPLFDSPAHHPAPPAKVADHQRHRSEDLETQLPTPYEVAPTTETGVEPEPQQTEATPPEEERHEEPDRPKSDPETAPIEEAISATPASESGATEYTEVAPPPAAETTSSASTSSGGGAASGASSSGTAAGGFGPRAAARVGSARR
jgi:hypothetical protein